MKDDLELKVNGLPRKPGVYFFKDDSGNILYIGKAVSLRDRVKSYFKDNLEESRSPWIARMLDEVADVDVKETDSALEALILEAKLIKENQPSFNSREKDDKSFNYVIITKDRFPVVYVARERDLEKRRKEIEKEEVFGPFPQGAILKDALRIIRKIFPFRDEKCTPAELQNRNSLKPCFNRQIGLCPGVCIGEMSATEYKKRIKNIKMFFQGRKKEVIKRLEKERDRFSENREFEKAGEVQKKIYALKHIRDVSLLSGPDFERPLHKDVSTDPLKKKPLRFRIEGYDIAHTFGYFTVGVFSVVEEGKPKKKDYRRFRLKKDPGMDDIKALKEVLSRRMDHEEWPFPDLVVVDGGVAQEGAVKEVLKYKDVDIPVIAVSKDRNHRPHRYYGDRELLDLHKKEIVLANMEAHRFAISYHRLLREKIKR
ncbi:MAG: GIY-YIG nuclease family protein [Patescibacteria group bacterium]